MIAPLVGSPVTVRPRPDRRSPGTGGPARATPRILLVDEHPAVRRGLAAFLEAEGLGECLEAGGRCEALDLIRNDLPDVGLVDVSRNRDELFTLLHELRARHVPVLACSTEENPVQVRRALKAGVRGFITTDEARNGIAHALRNVLNGWIVLSPRAVEGLEDQPDNT